MIAAYENEETTLGALLFLALALVLVPGMSSTALAEYHDDVPDVIMSVDLTDASVSGAKPYLLSTDEAQGLPNKLRKFSDWWWLRSAGTGGDECADCVDEFGSVLGSCVDVEDSMRPALQLDLSKVTFDKSTKTFALPTVPVTGVTLEPNTA